MSITTYTELQQAIADWLERADLAARIPDFIALFEATANRRLRLRQQEAVATLAPASGAAALPADFLGVRRVTWTGQSRVELEYVQPSYLQAAYPAAPAGVPRVYSIEGATLRIRPVDGTALELDYFQKIPALSAGASWLFGALAEACLFAPEKAALAPVWKARRDEIFDELELLSNRSRAASGSGVRVMGQTP